MSGVPTKDLIVLVADQDMLFSLRGLLSRPGSLGIRAVEYDVYPHPHHDPACLLEAHDFLRPFVRSYVHALVVFDREGCGQEHRTRDELEQIVEKHLTRNGWDDHAAAIAIDPELENWVWSNSPHVDLALGWKGRQPSLSEWLVQDGFVQVRYNKPARPKEAMEKALRMSKKSRSSSVFKLLAETVGVEGCADSAFNKFRETLKTWFPVQADEINLGKGI
jgi:hypothetical protein